MVEVYTPAGNWSSYPPHKHDTNNLRGYHPVGAPYGFDLYYLNVMAGPKRAWKFTTDPGFAWLLK